jgi:importin subunit beta-1
LASLASPKAVVRN